VGHSFEKAVWAPPQFAHLRGHASHVAL